MKLAEVLTLEEDIFGFTVNAKVLNAWEIKEYPGEHGPFSKQSIMLVDGEDKVYARLSSGFIGKGDIGKDIAISNCIMSAYNDAPQINTNSKSVVTIERTKGSAVKAKENVSPPKALTDIVTEAIEEVEIVLTHPKFSDLVKTGINAGVTSEDVRAMFISRMIEKSRSR